MGGRRQLVEPAHERLGRRTALAPRARLDLRETDAEADERAAGQQRDGHRALARGRGVSSSAASMGRYCSHVMSTEE